MSAVGIIKDSVAYLEREFNCHLCIHRVNSADQGKGFASLPHFHFNSYCLAIKKQNKSHKGVCFEFDGFLLRKFFREHAERHVEKLCPMKVLEMAFAVTSANRLVGILFAGPFRPAPEDAPEIEPERFCDCPESAALRAKLPRLTPERKRDLVALCELLSYRIGAELTPAALRSDRKSRIEDFILSHLREAPSPDDLASYLKLSRTHMNLLLHRYFDSSFVKLVNSYRIEEAKLLLKNTDFSIDFIAVTIGYTRAEYFHRLFRRAVGMTPRDFRNSQLSIDKRPRR